MVFLKARRPLCPQHCSKWARTYMHYCLCSVKDGLSLSLGFLSVISWGIAEIPQIITNYKKKCTEGLSITFLMTWIVGDLFNLFGCMLEPATLPTQYYMAMLYMMTTLILTGQTIYYGHIYQQLKRNRQGHKGSLTGQSHEAGKIKLGDAGEKEDKWMNGSSKANVLSSPIPLPALPIDSSPGRERYYISARSLSSSHTPTAGSFLVQRMTATSFPIRDSLEEPLLDGVASPQSAPAVNTKSMLCVVSVVTFLGTLNLHKLANYSLNVVLEDKKQDLVMRVGRKILQVSGRILSENDIEGSSQIGTFLGWAMAAIYMGGRLPQIFLNIKRGNVEGLSPLMFVFALVGNATYVGSILVNSLEWSKIRPNLPWLVDAGGCVLLDTFILMQFIYFRCWNRQ